MDGNSQSPGICRRLINFIRSQMNRPSSVSHRSNQVPIEEGLPRNEKTSIRPTSKANGYLDSEIGVDFRHRDGPERQTQIDEHGKKDGLILRNDQVMPQDVVHKKERKKDHFPPEIDQKTGTQSRGEGHLEVIAGEGLQKNITIKGSEGDLERTQKEEANFHLADQERKVNNQPHADKKLRPLWPLMPVDSNINEKSDAYIENRKKAISRNYTLDTEKS